MKMLTTNYCWLLRLQLIISVSLIFLYSSLSLKEAADGSVCFNSCSGHGECKDYSCHCYVGYEGDDCSHTFGDTSNLIPIMGAGDFNLTKKNFTQTISKNKFLLVGFSSYTCHKCIQVEPSYVNISRHLTDLKVKFGRADAAALRTYSAEAGVTSLPALVLYKKNRPILFNGVQSEEPVMAFVKKQLSKPVVELKRVQDVNSFLSSRNEPKYSISTVMVVGFFSDHEEIEEDDYEDYTQAAEELQTYADIYFGVVKNVETCEWFKRNKTIDRTPSMYMIGEDSVTHSINLDELYGDRLNIKDWILTNSVPLVGKLTNQNFALYEKIGRPMLLMFLDLENESQSNAPGRVVGGKSGNVLNEHLLDELRAVAKEHSDRISFVFLDGNLHEDKMKSLGLFGGKERLPSIAFNTKDNLKIPFPESLPINKDTLLQFCADYISGKLRSAADAAEMAKKALQASIPINRKNTAVRRERRAAPAVVTGVSEQFGDGNRGDDAVVAVNSSSFESVVMDEEKDVLLMIHAVECEACAHFSVYFKRMAQRFKELDIPTLVVARMNVSEDTPPAHLNLLVTDLPILVLLSAVLDENQIGGKQPPFLFYSGVGKVQQMMKWVEKHVANRFVLPNLPHLSDDQKIAYKTQVREREEYLEEKRKKEEDEMREEALAQERAMERAKKRESEGSKTEEGKGEIENLVGGEREEEKENRVGNEKPKSIRPRTKKSYITAAHEEDAEL